MFLDELARVLRLNVPTERKLRLVQREVDEMAIAEDELERQRLLLLHKRYVGRGPEVRQEGLTGFNQEETIDLSIARKNEVIYDRPFKSITITENLPGATSIPHGWGDMGSKAYIRFNSLASPLYRVRYGEVKGDFNKIFLTNVAQPGESFSFVIHNYEEASYRMIGDTAAVLEAIERLKGTGVKKDLCDLSLLLDGNLKYSVQPGFMNYVAITNSDTEYELTVPIYTKILKVVLVDRSTFRLAWETGKVAAPTLPYWTQPPNTVFELNNLYLESDKTLYVASPVGTKTAVVHYSR